VIRMSSKILIPTSSDQNDEEETDRLIRAGTALAILAGDSNFTLKV
jgi:hypothetical protein